MATPAPDWLKGLEPKDQDSAICAEERRRVFLNKEENCAKCCVTSDDPTVVWDAKIGKFRCYRCKWINMELTEAAAGL